MNKLEHWQNPGQRVTHGWITAENSNNVCELRAPVGNRIALDMAGVKALHAWLGELLEQESKAAGLEGSGVKS